jgi:hypothetical protein
MGLRMWVPVARWRYAAAMPPSESLEPPWHGLPWRPADWSQAIPDLIGGVFVALAGGVVVGIVLSNRDAKREARYRGEMAWSYWVGVRGQIAEAMPHKFVTAHKSFNDMIAQTSGPSRIVEPGRAAQLVEDSKALQECDRAR